MSWGTMTIPSSLARVIAGILLWGDCKVDSDAEEQVHLLG